jgi:hypothetical protein
MIARQDRGERPVPDDDAGDYTVPLSLFPARGVTVGEPAPAAQRSRVGEIAHGLAATIADETATEEAQVAQRQRLARIAAALFALGGRTAGLEDPVIADALASLVGEAAHKPTIPSFFSAPQEPPAVVVPSCRATRPGTGRTVPCKREER